jgi:multimeric flavodoxin WrbA
MARAARRAGGIRLNGARCRASREQRARAHDGTRILRMSKHKSSRRPRRAPKPRVVTGAPSVELSEQEFKRRFRERHYDPDFDAVSKQLEDVAEVAWRAYIEYHKSPRTKKAGAAFAHPDFHLPIEWLATRARIREAERTRKKTRTRSRILLVSASSRSDQTCPGEMSKTYRLTKIAQRAIERHPRFDVDLLDLSVLTSEYGRVIYPCKACVSTAMPLCHWPCSCYPNHAMGQTQDWMNEIYPRWVAAHGVMIVTPVHWYQAPSVLKLMIDRLVCADGGNPDPTTTGGKDPARAKAIELAGWDYPKHLAGRAFSVVVHGDAAGAETLRRVLCDWLTDLHLVRAGRSAVIDRYVGYYRPYATSHDDLDEDTALQREVRNAAASLVEIVERIRAGRFSPPDEGLEEARKK